MVVQKTQGKIDRGRTVESGQAGHGGKDRPAAGAEPATDHEVSGQAAHKHERQDHQAQPCSLSQFPEEDVDHGRRVPCVWRGRGEGMRPVTEATRGSRTAAWREVLAVREGGM